MWCMCMTWWISFRPKVKRPEPPAARYALGEEIGGRCIELKNGNAVNYTVPQHIRVEGVDKLCEVFFRVNNVYRDRVITVTDEAGTLLCRFPREHMAPARWRRSRCPAPCWKKPWGASPSL